MCEYLTSYKWQNVHEILLVSNPAVCFKVCLLPTMVFGRCAGLEAQWSYTKDGLLLHKSRNQCLGVGSVPGGETAPKDGVVW